MNKYIKVCGILVLMIFSFYYTEKVALYVQNNTPLKKEIISYKENNSIDYVNAEIDGIYIIPGINGLEINVDKSYNKMKSYNVFSEKYLIYDQVKPEISIDNFKNKIISRANSRKNGVSIILSEDNSSIDYFKNTNTKYDLLGKSKYCIRLIKSDCESSSKQIVEPTLILRNQNFLKDVNKVSKGYIIYLSSDININYIQALVKHIKYNNLNIYKLNDHLTENYEL